MVVFGQKEELFPDIMKGMNALRKDKSFYDVCINVGGHEIRAHKSVLISVSDYFKSLLIGPFKTDASIVEVDFTSIALDVESAEAVIEFLYTGTINIDEENLEAILKLATFLLIKQLQDLCINFMERSSDLTSYMKYFQLSVDYMVPDAEAKATEIVKARFHDLFLYDDTTKNLSPCHLQKLMEDYDVFENCSSVDILSFIVDWVVDGQTEEHYLVGLKTLETMFEEESSCEEDLESDSEDQSNQDVISNIESKSASITQDANNPKHDKETNVYQVPQCSQQSLGDQEEQNEPEKNCNQLTPGSQESNNSQSLTYQPENNGKPQTFDEESLSIEMEPKGDDEEQISDDDQPLFGRRPGLDIPLEIEKIKCKLDSLNAHLEFVDKCKEIIDKEFCSITPACQREEDFTSATNTGKGNPDFPEHDAEQVLIAVVPKKCLKDFLANSKSYEHEISCDRDKAIFDICVYIPGKHTWYYIGEGTNNNTFKEIGKKDSQWPINFCMNDKLCCVSLDQECLYMYPLTHPGDLFSDRQWSKVSYEYIIRKYTNEDTEFDKRHDVRICCNDGERVYLVLKIKSSSIWGEDLEIEFKCFRLSDKHKWKFMFDIPITDDLDVYESRHFDVHVSPGKNDMLIAVTGDQFKVFRVNLENIREGFQEYTLEYENKWTGLSEISWILHSHFWIIRSKNRLSFVDEIYVDERNELVFRNVMIKDKAEDMSVDYTEHRVFEPQFPSGYRLETNSKLFQSLGTGSSVWLYLSDGKFQTSLYETRLSKYGAFINHHISPPFQSVTLLAAGMVKTEILANLKPVKTFLLE